MQNNGKQWNYDYFELNDGKNKQLLEELYLSR